MTSRPRLPLAGRTVVITGAAKGIGAATARIAHARGASVAVLDIDGAGADRLAHDLGSNALSTQVDVRDTGALGAAVARVREELGGMRHRPGVGPAGARAAGPDRPARRPADHPARRPGGPRGRVVRISPRPRPESRGGRRGRLRHRGHRAGRARPPRAGRPRARRA
jgi:hypothetical protein